MLMQTGKNGPQGKGIKRSTLRIRRSKFKVIRDRSCIWRPEDGIILDPLGGEAFYHAMRCISAPAVSVCLSVRPSRSWILSKWINVSSKFFYHRVATPFYVFPYQTLWQYSDVDSPNGGVECNAGRVGKNRDSRPISGYRIDDSCSASNNCPSSVYNSWVHVCLRHRAPRISEYAEEKRTEHINCTQR